MTAQISDTISIHNQKYSIVGVNGGELFTPQSLRIYPIGIMSACWQGYVCHYKISDSRLLLDQLQLTLGIYEGSGKERKFVAQTGPAINGIKPSLPEGQWVTFNNIYEELNLEVRFSGGLLAGADFIEQLYVHMGFHPAWKFQTVFELLIEEGHVHELRDVSKEIERVRESMLKLPREPEIRKTNQQEIESWIEQSFQLDYDLKPWVHFDL